MRREEELFPPGSTPKLTTEEVGTLTLRPPPCAGVTLQQRLYSISQSSRVGLSTTTHSDLLDDTSFIDIFPSPLCFSISTQVFPGTTFQINGLARNLCPGPASGEAKAKTVPTIISLYFIHSSLMS